MDRFFKFLAKGQKKWTRKEKIDYSQINKKYMNSIQKWREDNPPKYIKDTPPAEIKETDKPWGYILKTGVRFFNGDILEPEMLNKELNDWIENDWIWELRTPNLGIGDCKKIQKHLHLEIIKIEHSTTHVNETDRGALFTSVMIHFRITCVKVTSWDKIKKLFEC